MNSFVLRLAQEENFTLRRVTANIETALLIPDNTSRTNARVRIALAHIRAPPDISVALVAIRPSHWLIPIGTLLEWDDNNLETGRGRAVPASVEGDIHVVITLIKHRIDRS